MNIESVVTLFVIISHNQHLLSLFNLSLPMVVDTGVLCCENDMVIF